MHKTSLSGLEFLVTLQVVGVGFPPAFSFLVDQNPV